MKTTTNQDSSFIIQNQNVPISEFRTNISHFVDNAENLGISVVVIRNSRPSAALVGSEEYEQFRQWRKEQFWKETDEAFEELEKGEGKSFDSMEELIADLNNDQEDSL
ncbi:type II toxin-antitoxin system Phd/YefM family antitoxin [Candidatus Gracilibacteria bacterium]|nr:type II toxin-antitoxin system Phd/YefM family antitoxin [Candidatus Gracilibacteria bacterium]